MMITLSLGRLRLGHLLEHSVDWRFLKIRDPFLGVPIIRIRVFGGLYWGSLILGNYHLGFRGWVV